MAGPYCPKRADVVWLTFDPQAGHEQAGRHPALVISPESYNRKVGLVLLCPLTQRKKNYPFEVDVPQGLPVSGVMLADQLKSMDWRARKTEYCCKLPDTLLQEVVAKAQTLLTP